MFSFLLSLSLLLPVTPVTEVPGPAPGASYLERDPAAIAMHPRPGENARFRRSLNAAIRKDPNNSLALIHRAYLLHASGDIEEGDRDFQRVLGLAQADPLHRRRALWSLGWSAQNRGFPRHAVAFWHQAAQLHGGRPSWYPYTVALGLWSLGDKQAALAWFDVATRGDADWSRLDAVKARTSHWREPERLALLALYQAWVARQGSDATPSGT